MVTELPPLFLNVSERLAFPPTATFPSERLDGFGLSAPCATPVAETGMLKLGFDPFDATVRLPLAVPVAIGAKVTVNDVLCPAARVIGSESPTRLNPVPVTDADEIVTL